MAITLDIFQKETLEAWDIYMDSLEKSFKQLENDIDEAASMTNMCTGEWCQATEHVIDDLGNALFSISEPRWSSDKQSQRIKSLKRRLHDLYAKYKGIPKTR
jgi:hypothetical protein